MIAHATAAIADRSKRQILALEAPPFRCEDKAFNNATVDCIRRSVEAKRDQLLLKTSKSASWQRVPCVVLHKTCVKKQEHQAKRAVDERERIARLVGEVKGDALEEEKTGGGGQERVDGIVRELLNRHAKHDVSSQSEINFENPINLMQKIISGKWESMDSLWF